jgi:PilZ domain-containing protein
MSFEGKIERSAVRPRDFRADVAFDVVVRSGSRDVDARIVNMSGQGFRIRSSRPLEAGCEVALQVAELPPVKAVIRWARGFEAGGVFLEAMAL